MGFSKPEMLDIVRRQLAIDLNCDPEDFLRDGVVFCEAALNEGHRLFDRQSPYLEIATMGRSVVISGDADILKKVKPLLENKAREDILAAPFLYGHSLYYLPDGDRMTKLPCPDGLAFHIEAGREIHRLYEFPGFQNAIQYDPEHPRPDVLVTYATHGKKIVGMAGASADSQTMWQIGIDVFPQYRNMGLAACLVSNLAVMIMERGIVPYYGTASSNIPSQSVAHRSGFAPAWMCSYKNSFDGKSPYQDKLRVELE